MNYICLNGQIVDGDQPWLQVDNRGFRYGDGFFETIRVIARRIPLFSLHMDRFFSTSLALGYSHQLGATQLEQDVLALCLANDCAQAARVRLTAFRGNGHLHTGDDQLQYIIEAEPLSPVVTSLNRKGLQVDIYPHARKAIDAISSFKTANFLPYALAARFAKQNQWDDALVLNTAGRVADATIANVFTFKNNDIFTPPLSEAGVNGVMRRWLIDELSAAGIPVHEVPLTIVDLKGADELFLSNAISGIKWVERMGDKMYVNLKTEHIYNSFITKLWS